MDLAERTVSGLHSYLAEILQDYITDKAANVLDVGCGTGAFMSRLKSLGYTNLHGVDQSAPEGLAAIEARHFDLNRDDPNSLGQYDLVTCIEVIEHIENIGNLLDCLKIALKPTGLAVITTPNIESIFARTRSLLVGQIPHFDERSDPTHLMPVLRASLEKMLSRRGMRVEKLLSYPSHQGKTQMFSRKTTAIARLLSPLVPDDVPGDNTVYLIRHAAGRCSA